MDITEFLAARYDEDEETARGAIVEQPNGAHWQIGNITHREDYEFVDLHTAPPNAIEIAGAGFDGTGGVHGGGFATHIVRHDPAHVLDDITIKRYLLNEYRLAAAFDVKAATEAAIATGDAGDEETGLIQLAEAAAKESAKNVMLGVIKAHASAYALHPDYDPAWSLWPHVRQLAEQQ